MFKLIKQDGSEITLETEKGRFILTSSFDPDCPGFYVDYQEPGKPTRNLAVVEHDLDDDKLRTLVWEGSNSDNFDYSHEITHKRPENKELMQLTTAIQQINTTHSGLDLEVRRIADEASHTFELGYVQPQTFYFFPLRLFHFVETYPADVEYCTSSLGWRYHVQD